MTTVIKLISKARDNPQGGLAGPVYYTSAMALSARQRGMCFPLEVITGDVTGTIVSISRSCRMEPDRLLKQRFSR